MANREKGEIEIQVGGRPYTLVLNTNALVALQDVCSTPKAIMPIDEIYDRVNQGSLRHVRAFLWASLRKYHPELTIEAVGELVDEAGGLIELNKMLEAVQQASQPDPADVKELQPPAKNPRKARATTRGTGGVFTSMRAKSA